MPADMVLAPNTPSHVHSVQEHLAVSYVLLLVNQRLREAKAAAASVMLLQVSKTGGLGILS